MYAGRFLIKFRSLNGSIFYNHGFLQMSNPLRIRGRTKNLMMTEFRRRHPGAVLNEEFPKNYALNEIQDPPIEISPALT